MLVAVILFEQPARRFLGAPLGTLTPYTVTGTNDNFVTITNNQKLTQIANLFQLKTCITILKYRPQNSGDTSRGTVCPVV